MADLPFSPTEVLNLLGIYPDSSREAVYIDCPNCGGRKKLNIRLNGEKAHLCRCNRCDWTGNSITYYQKVTNSTSPFKDILANTKGNVTVNYREEKRLTSSMASIEARNRAFVNMIMELPLKDEDKRNLLKRGLTEEFIKKHGYRSIYFPTYEETKAIAKRLERKGCLLKGVQGFYKHKGSWEAVRIKHKCFTVPYLDRHGLIQGFQMRKRDFLIYFVDTEGSLISKEFVYKHDSLKLTDYPEPPYVSGYKFVKWSSELKDITENKVVYPIYKSITDEDVIPKKFKVSKELREEMEKVDDNRYFWFASRDYEEGVGSPCFVHYATEFSVNLQSRKLNAVIGDTLFITEGALKGDIFHFFTKLPCLCISGVNCTSELYKEMEAWKNVKKVVIAFDMDYLTNEYVQKAEQELRQKLSDMGFEVYRLTWDSTYKGIDDYCLSNNGRFFINLTDQKSVLTCVSKE